MVYEDKNLASRGARIASFVVDFGLTMTCRVAGAVFGGVLAAAFSGAASDPASDDGATMIILQGFALGFVFWGMVAWFLNYGIIQGLTGATLGKHLFKLRVTNEDGSSMGVLKSLFRSVGYAISIIPFYAGFVAVFWTRKHQAFHDSIFNTIVVNKEATQQLIPVPILESYPVYPEEKKAA